MKKRTYIKYVSFLFTLFAVQACSDNLEQATGISEGTSELQIRLSSFQGEDFPLVSGEDRIESMKAYRFEEGILRKVYDPIKVSSDIYRLPLDRLSGMLYVVANGTSVLDFSIEGSTTETDWLQTVVSTKNGEALHYFTQKIDLSNQSETQPMQASLTRGVARFDFRIKAEGNVSVTDFVFRQVAQQAYFFSDSTVRSPENVVKSDYAVCTPEMPLSQNMSGILYLYEQVNSALSVYLQAVIDGKTYTFEKVLPETIHRNTVYTIVLRKDVLDVEARLEVEAWGNGNGSDLFPDYANRVKVDLLQSELPEGVEVSATKDAVTLPYWETDLLLAVACDNELEALPVSDMYGVTVESVPIKNKFDGLNRFRIRKLLYPPNVANESFSLQFRRKGFQHVYPEDAITFSLSANPTMLSGNMEFGVGKYQFDFERYVDNELGILNLPEGKELLLVYAEGEDEWVKIMPVEGQSDAYRIVAGWRPNDPTANGRKQDVTLVICNRIDGSCREEYTVSRRNYGLPVTWLHGIWWCKYNACGNSRSFEDQVLSSNDPARLAGKTVFEYLADCTPEVFFDLWKWAYQGDSGMGMQVIDKDGVAVMDRYSGQVSAHINRLPPDALSPEGYELPSMEDFNRIFDATDYVWVMWNGMHELKIPWEGHSRIRRTQQRRNDITVGSIALTDLITIEMQSPDFPEYEPIVWYGPGAQWNDAGIYHGHYNNILWSVCSPEEGSGWYLAGSMGGLYLTKNGAGNRDTRVLRFKKSPVEFVY